MSKSRWDADGPHDDLQAYAAEQPGEADGVLIVDDTGFAKKGTTLRRSSPSMLPVDRPATSLTWWPPSSPSGPPVMWRTRSVPDTPRPGKSAPTWTGTSGGRSSDRDIITAAHFMSVRSLHNLFEAEGITVSRLIQRRRLQECARDLARGDCGERMVSGVARRRGFTNPACFSRLFRTAYDMSPSRWRDTRGGAAPSEPSVVVDGPFPISVMLRLVTRSAIGDPSMTKHSKTVDLTCGEAATHGVSTESRDLLDLPPALVRFHAGREPEPVIDLLPDMFAGPSDDETFRHRQATPKGGVTGRHGPSPASAGECGQEGA
ncbi:helix-turn-helix domain-containing protein [Streptomyces atratus]|nr:helix-turn-helix domain-containing protein [Streptomyces atratus]MCX5345043.1 helix-turn-helix domain-containing protein [Streptomyces atratus]